MADALLNQQGVIVLCEPDRAAAYESVCKVVSRTLRVSIADGVDEVLRQCMVMPQLAVLVDSGYLLKNPEELEGPLFHLRVIWPVLRCTTDGSGQIIAECSEPKHQEPLCNALTALIAHSPAWEHPRYTRQHLRLEARLHVQLQIGDDDPVAGQTQNISSGGLFVVTQAAASIGDVINTEISGLAEEPLSVVCLVAQTQSWDADPLLNGLGLRLAGGQVTELRKMLTTPAFIHRLRNSIQ